LILVFASIFVEEKALQVDIKKLSGTEEERDARI